MHSGQRKRYLKSLNQKKKVVVFLGIVKIVIAATNLAKTASKTCYGLIKYLDGMRGSAVRVRLAPSGF